MGRLAFLSMEDLSGYVTDDALALPPLRARGWEVEEVPWRAGADWAAFDAVVIRSTWDYTRHPGAFLEVLAEIDRSTRLVNDLRLVRWNLRKTYLVEMERRGVPVPTTVWGRALAAEDVPALFDRLGTDEVVVKPAVGAGAVRTLRLRRADLPRAAGEAAAALGDREYLAQPFLPAVTEEGEFSLFFFAGDLAHSVLKTPRPADFRVQEEHGGSMRPVTPEPALVQAARRAMAALPHDPLYARTDFVRDARGVFRLMEIELIEPSLYLRMDPMAPERFAAALDTFLRSR